MKNKKDPIVIAGDMENYRTIMLFGLLLAVFCFIGAWFLFNSAERNEESAEWWTGGVGHGPIGESIAADDRESAREQRETATFCSIFGLIGLVVSFAYFVQFTSVNPYPRKWGLFNLTEEVSNINSMRAKKERTKQAERRKQWVENANIVALLKELDKSIENLRRNYSTKSEQIVIGQQKVGEGTMFERNVPQYSTRTRDVPEHVVEKRISDSLPNDIELEIIRRGTNVLDDLIGKYRSGENLEITKRILKKLTAGEVGKKFEEYEMLEDAENWYASNKLFNDAKRLKEKMRFKVDQTVVHGDYVDDRDTIVKDSVINRSNVGGGSSKMQELEKLTEMKKEGLISDEEYEKMKQEIIG